MSDAGQENNRPTEVMPAIKDDGKTNESPAVKNRKEPRVTGFAERVVIPKDEWERIRKAGEECVAVIQRNHQQMETMKRKLEQYEAQSKQPTPAAAVVAEPGAKKVKEEPPEEAEIAPEAAATVQTPIPIPADKEVKIEYTGMEAVADPQAIATEADSQTASSSSLAAPRPPPLLYVESLPPQPQPVANAPETAKEHDYSAPVKEVKFEYDGYDTGRTVRPTTFYEEDVPVEKLYERDIETGKWHDVFKILSPSKNDKTKADGYDSDASSSTSSPPILAPEGCPFLPEDLSLWLVTYLTSGRKQQYPKLWHFFDSDIPANKIHMKGMMSSMQSLFKTEPVIKNGVTPDQIKAHLLYLKSCVIDGAYGEMTPYLKSIEKVSEAVGGAEGLKNSRPVKKEIKEEAEEGQQ